MSLWGDKVPWHDTAIEDQVNHGKHLYTWALSICTSSARGKVVLVTPRACLAGFEKKPKIQYEAVGASPST